MRILPYSLQGRFLTGLVAIMLVMGLFFAFALRAHMRDLFLSEARAKANIMAAHTEAIQGYVREVLRPAVSNVIEADEFIIEAMSTSFVTRHVLDRLDTEGNDFTYRRVAKNARNPDSELNDHEQPFFDRFAAEKNLQRVEAVDMVKGRENLTVARPVLFTPDCMRCHGDSKDAPAVLLAMYGKERGFWRQSGELAGLDILSVPLGNASGTVGNSITMFAVWFGSGMIILLLTVQGFFSRLVVHNLRRVGAILQRNFFQDADAELLAPLRNEEEIEGMVRSIETVATHLSETREQLRGYTKNLESMVTARTADLETVVRERSADVQLFVRLLNDLNHNQEKHELLQASIGLVARHFNATRAVYMCGLSGSDFMVWPSEDQKTVVTDTALRANLADHLRKGEPALSTGVWHIPVQTSELTRGLLVLFWNIAPGDSSSIGTPSVDQLPLAMAFGRQLGIALDNLDALDTLLRQNTLLDSIVEGIADPLILVEQDSLPVLTNSSARNLAIRLLPSDASTPDVFAPVDHISRVVGGAQGVGRLLHLMGIVSGQPLPKAPMHREVEMPDGLSFVVSVHPLWGRGASLTRAVVHLRETTEEKRMLVHLRQSEKLAAVGQLAAGLAHEINNPLGVIRCYAELLGNAATGDQNRADIDVILRHVEQAQMVLRDLLDFARPHDACPGPCNVGALLTSLREIFRPKVRSAHVEMRLEVEPHLPELSLDAGMLEQVLVNLLLNALDAVSEHFRHAEGQGIISIQATHDVEGEQVCITVADNGAGIAEDNLSRIFDPFFTTKDPGSGTGLGLTMAFGLTRDMGGRLEAQNVPMESGNDGGALFRIFLPIREDCV